MINLFTKKTKEENLKNPTRDEQGRIDLEFWMNLSPEESLEYYIDVGEAKEVHHRAKEQAKSSPQEVILKPEMLDTSNIEEGEGKKQYRPNKLENYIGQQEAKDRIKSYIKGCAKYNETFPHTFLSAPAGHGKTLLSNIIANILDKKFVVCTGGEIKSEQQFVDKIIECEGGVILIDEANRLSKKVGFFMLPTIEQFEIHGKKIKPFTVIFATTHKGDLAKDLDALIQRCDLQLELNHYNNDELVTILKQYKEKQYPKEDIPENVYFQVAECCRFTPRIALSLLREYIFIKDWEQVLKNNKIIKDGLNSTDIKILAYLNEFKQGLGKNTISNYLKVKPQTYEHEYEPYLIYKGLIIVDSRRKITEKGKELLNEIK